jgi:hypothetical protein
MLKRMRSFLVVVMLLITATMSAQVTTASMSGKVTAQDEPIIGATIVAIHEPSGTRYGTVSNSICKVCVQAVLTKSKSPMSAISQPFTRASSCH